MQQLFGAFRSLPEVPRNPSGGTKGSVPGPADAAYAQMFPLLAHAAPNGLKPAALRDFAGDLADVTVHADGRNVRQPPMVAVGLCVFLFFRTKTRCLEENEEKHGRKRKTRSL